MERSFELGGKQLSSVICTCHWRGRRHGGRDGCRGDLGRRWVGRDGSFLCLPTIQMGSKSLKYGELVKGAIAIKNGCREDLGSETDLSTIQLLSRLSGLCQMQTLTSLRDGRKRSEGKFRLKKKIKHISNYQTIFVPLVYSPTITLVIV